MSNHISRRTLLKWLSVAPVALSATQTQAQAKIATSARIVIVGAGMAGLAIANQLSNRLDGAKITIIDKKTVHHYQPGFTLIAVGLWDKNKVIGKNQDVIPNNVKWIQEPVIEFEPDQNQLTIESGTKVNYDFLIIATGLVLDYAKIEGMDIKAIGQNGLASIYPSPEAAAATWQALDKFRKTGGKAVMTLPHTYLKCAGAPLKTTFMLNDHLTRAGTRASSQIQFYSALNNVFSVPVINADVLRRWNDLNIPVNFKHSLSAIDIHARKATFDLDDGKKIVTDYDFIHVVPPMRAPDCIINSNLSSKIAPYASEGWLAVNKDTLQHLVYPNVFGAGDINGTPKGKTAATIKKSVPLIVDNLISVILGSTPTRVFDGYTSCPLLLRQGSALLIEFDYENNLTPSIPGVRPLTDSYFAWLMKTKLLKPAYIAVIKGQL